MKSISEIKREFEQAGELELPALFAQYESDVRNGVTALIVRYRKQLAKLSAERERLEKMRCYEHSMSSRDWCAELMKRAEVLWQVRLWRLQ